MEKQKINNEDEKCKMEAKKRTSFLYKMAEILSLVAYYNVGEIDILSIDEILG